MIYIGIDPGLSGGIANLGINGSDPYGLAMPESTNDIWMAVRAIAGMNPVGYYVYAVIEQNTGYVPFHNKDGGKGNIPSYTMYKFGRNAGMCEMALHAIGVQPDLIVARVWQKGLDIATKARGENKQQFKKRLKEEAIRRFPRTEVTLYNCDALLIAEYCRRKQEGKL